MGLSVGIIGMPNVGKSTIFNALVGARNARAENFPFCTVEPNHAIVPLPDERLEKIAALTHPQKVTHAAVEFTDIAGLVRNASKGEGLGNQFLANIAETHAVLHVVRCFADPNVVHVEGDPNPVRDIEIVETELLLRDIQLLDAHLAKIGKMVRNDKSLQAQIEVSQKLLAHLNEGKPAASFVAHDTDAGHALYREIRFTTDKKAIYCANADDTGVGDDNPHVHALKEYAARKGVEVVVIAGKMEEELVGMSAEERKEFLASYGLDQSALDRMIRAAGRALGLVSFFTIQSDMAQAWTVRRGTKAPQAAGTIHTDFEKGFIRAEVVSFDDFVKHGSEAACRTAGALRTEGKDYLVRDGDLIRFLFNA